MRGLAIAPFILGSPDFDVATAAGSLVARMNYVNGKRRYFSGLFFGCGSIDDNPARPLAAKRKLCLESLLRVKFRQMA